MKRDTPNESLLPLYFYFYLNDLLEQGYAVMPKLFTRRLYGDIHESVYFIDPAGNRHRVAIDKVEGQIYMTDGWNELGTFYRIMCGGWMKMIYMTTGRFLIRVHHKFGEEVLYPTPPSLKGEDDDEIPTWDHEPEYEEPTLEEMHLPWGDVDFCHTLVKVITYADVFGEALVMPFPPLNLPVLG